MSQRAAPITLALCALPTLGLAGFAEAQDSLPLCSRSAAHDVNDAGWIVGTVEVPHEGRLAVAWVGDSVIRLGSLGGDVMNREYGVARAVDEEGRVVGTTIGADRQEHGFLWEAGEMTDLAPLRHAVGVDGEGRILGNRNPTQGSSDAILWIDGEITSPGTWASISSSRADA